MTVEIAFLFALIAAMVVLFLTEKLPVDLTAFAGLVVLVFAGFVQPEEAFAGFASPAVITMLSIFFVSAALQYTGVAAAMGARIHRVVGSREVPLIAAIMIVGGVLSAFMNNIAAAAVLMPAVVSLGRKAGVAPSRLLMPLAFGCILGGTTTLVGTPPNLLAAAALEERNLTPFALFDFAPYGAALLLAGVLFMVTIGRKLLPERGEGMAAAERADLASVYRLDERLFHLDVPQGSELAGKSLEDSRLSTVLGVQVVAIEHGEKEEELAPQAEHIIREGDRLVVEGHRADLVERLGLQGVEMGAMGSAHLGTACSEICGAVVQLKPDSPLAGRSLRELRFRNRFRVEVAACWRAEECITSGLGDLNLEPGDELLFVGDVIKINELAARPDLDVLVEGPEAMERLDTRLFVLHIPEDSPLVGQTLIETKLRENFDVTVVGVARGEESELIDTPNDRIQANDRLLVTGRETTIAQLLQVGEVKVADDLPTRTLESEDVGLVEVVVAPRSAAVGHTLRDLAIRKKYGLRALALWRGGQPLRDQLPDQPLRLGDGLLLHGPREKFGLLKKDPDFVVLSEGTEEQGPHRPKKAPFALGALLLMVVLVVAGVFPIQVAAFTAATLVVLTRALKMREAYRAIEWRAVFLVAAILPIGAAMESTGAAALLADTVAGLAGDAGPYAVLIALMILSSLLSQGLDGAPTVVLLAPVVVSTAERLDLSPYPLMMGVGLAASAAFMTPFSHKANLLVMGAGGYRAMDYVRVGTPLTIIVLGLLALMLPLLMPFAS